MQTNPAIDINSADMQAARELLTSTQEQATPIREKKPGRAKEERAPVVVHQGITRARMRSISRNSA